jgi:hypothetical protein
MSGPRIDIDRAGDLEPEIEHLVSTLCPMPKGITRGEWRAHGEAVRSWARAASLDRSIPLERRCSRIPRFLSSGIRLAAWCGAREISLAAEIALAQHTIDRHVAELVAAGDRSARTYRSYLRMMARSIESSLVAPYGVNVLRQGVVLPYSDVEMSRFEHAIDTQPRDALRLGGWALLGAGAGAGASGGEAGRLLGTDVLSDRDGLAIDFHGQRRRPSPVPVLRRYESRLAEVASAAGGTWLVEPGLTKRRNGPYYLAQRLALPAGQPRLEAARLRATWLVELMRRRIPVGLICRTAGLRTPASLGLLVEHVPDADPEHARAWLRGEDC